MLAGAIKRKTMGAEKNTTYKNGQKQKKSSNIKPDSEL